MGLGQREPGALPRLAIVGGFGGIEGGTRPLQPFRGEREQQVADGAVLVAPPDELAHHPQLAVDVDAPLVDGELTGDRAEQRRLARTVRADERHVLPAPGAEGDVARTARRRRGCDTRSR